MLENAFWGADESTMLKSDLFCPSFLFLLYLFVFGSDLYLHLVEMLPLYAENGDVAMYEDGSEGTIDRSMMWLWCEGESPALTELGSWGKLSTGIDSLAGL